VSNQITYGVNRFKRKYSFASRDSVVTFYLKNNVNAGRVMLAGSFNEWSPDALSMRKTDSGWIAYVKLGAGKYWYKFVVDGRWTTDPDNLLNENDGLGNVNSVFFKTNALFTLNGFTDARKVFLAGSFNDWQERGLAMQETATGWQLPVYLANGTHTYRYIVDGRWMIDPDNKNKLPNEFNDFNSVVRIGKPYLFRLDGYQDAKKVVLAGSFNKWVWHELFLTKKSGGWEIQYTLGPGNYEYMFVVDGKEVKNPQQGHSGNFYFIMQPNFTFRLKGFANAKNVFLAGDFNGWSPNTFAMKREGDEWVLKVNLSKGKHLYKFVVDGKWILDPANKLWEQNQEHTGNSIVWMAD
jgi:1,4-alpha-glucan branching enzyme